LIQFVRRYAKSFADVPLRVHVHDKHLVAELGQGVSKVDGRSSFGNAALLISNNYSSHVYHLKE
jgi:hypothetical protein